MYKRQVAGIVPLSFSVNQKQWLHASGIQDYQNNTTRFLVVRSRGENERPDYSLKKTSLFIEFHDDRSGLLYQLLSVFNLFQINLCRLESRPAKNKPWAYVFYVDFYNTKNTKECLDVLNISLILNLFSGVGGLGFCPPRSLSLSLERALPRLIGGGKETSNKIDAEQKKTHIY